MNVSTQCEHKKHATEHILALRDPRNGFDSQRMDRKNRGNKRTAPRCSCHFLRDEKKKDRSDRVQYDVSEMVPPSLQSKQLAIQHVRDRSKWMQIPAVRMGQGPENTARGYACNYFRIFENIFLVIQI